MAEGAPLLREYRVYSPIEGSNPSLSASRTLEDAPVAQLDRVPDYESGGRRFESSRARQILNPFSFMRAGFLFSSLTRAARALVLDRFKRPALRGRFFLVNALA